MLGHMVSTWRRLLFNSGFRWDPLLLDEENHLPCSHLLLLPWDMSRGSPGSLLCPRCWVLCTLADSVSLRKCKVPISHCTGTQSQVQTYSLQGRCPKWDLQPMQLQVLTELPWDLLLQGTSESLCNDLQSPFSYLHMWVEVYNFFLYFFFCQIISTQLIITLNVVVIIFTISLTIHQVHQGEAIKRDSVLLFKLLMWREAGYYYSYTLHTYLFHYKIQFMLHKCISSIAFI